MDFEWDENKADSNHQKHAVRFSEAATEFGDPFAITFADPVHSEDEVRWLTLGRSVGDRVLIVSHTDREDRVRIISARKATKSERKIHEEEAR
jgi:uncharacterized DUF497 family protein